MHAVVQKATSGAGRRGRPPKFVRDDVIDAAVDVFWRKGVDHVTLDDLEAATGVDRSTLYNSFGGKTGLYRSAAERYVTAAVEQLFAPLYEIDDGIDAVTQMLERLRGINVAADLPPGCLIVNDLGSPHIDDAASDRYCETLRGGVEASLERAVAQGSLHQAAVAPLAALIVAGVLGANLTSHAIGRADAIAALDALIETVRLYATS